MKGCSTTRWLWVVVDGKSSQEYLVNAEVSQGFILSCTLFFVHINELPDDAICNISFYADDITPYSKYDQTSDLRQELELVFEVESDLRDTKD